jgi:hypothetical protein
MNWKTIIKEVETNEELVSCCEMLIEDMYTYLFEFTFGDAFRKALGFTNRDGWEKHLSVWQNTHVMDEQCEKLVQTLEDIEIDGIGDWLNKKGVDSKTINVGELSDFTKLLTRIIRDYRECATYEGGMF